MASDHGVRIEFLPSRGVGEPGNITDISPLTDLINRTYEVAEKGLWLAGAQRTTTREVDLLTGAGEIAVARAGQGEQEEIVGCIHVRQLDDRVGEFGMLAVALQWRNLGIGRKLVQFAEEHCKAAGLQIMQLELLVPRDWKHPVKVFLHDWYERMGYRRTRLGAIDESYPDLAPQLATACDFVIYYKNLQP